MALQDVRAEEHSRQELLCRALPSDVQKGSSNTGAKKMEKLIDRELADLKRLQEIEEIDNV